MHLAKRGALAVILLLCLAAGVAAQETRGMISGRVLDAQGGSVAGATVVVINTDTNVSLRFTSNETGYYEANLLLAGNYQVTAEISGFKKSIRTGLVLSVGAKLDVNMNLEVGTVSESISVTANAAMLDTSVVSSGRILDNRALMELPVIANNVINLARMTVGMQTSGVNPSYAMLGSVSAASDYYLPGKVGGSEWSIDGSPNNGASRQVGFLPYTDTVQEFRVETSNFDASVGHATGANVAVMTKSGTNAYHGTLTEQHFQQRWQGAAFFTKQNYYRNINAALAAGDTAKANYLRSQDKQPSGRSNNYAGTLGGPVTIPKVINGRDRLFFFFAYDGLRERKTQTPDALNTTMPTLAQRQGDFSDLLRVDPVQYQINDPLSVRPDPARSGHFVRDPIPGNLIPKTRMINPLYNTYVKFVPTPNNNPTDPKQAPFNNYLQIGSPYNWDFQSISNRVDYNATSKSRFFGRWHYNDFLENRGDWAYETYPGLNSAMMNRHNLGATVDWVYTPGAATVVNVTVGGTEYRTGNYAPVVKSFKPSDVGLPAYVDQHAGVQTVLPTVNVSGYTPGFNPWGYPPFSRYRSYNLKADVSHIHGSHTLRLGTDIRKQEQSGGGAGNTSGTFGFDSAYTRHNDDSFTPAGSLGLSWAAFMMGIPSSMTIANNDSFIWTNPYFGWFVMDNWRATPKLTLNIGLRLEYEMAPQERFNRMLTSFDPNAALPIGAAAQAAYAQSPVPELAASSFVVKGGSLYAGSNGASSRLFNNELMWLPRVSVAYEINSKTVFRAGYGTYYDSLNVTNMSPNQTGFSRSTSTTLTNDFGQNWLVGDPKNGVSPLTDPFPVRADGTRYDVPLRDALGLMAVVGRSFSFNPQDIKHARLQRWRAGVQRQFGSNLMIEAAYSGSYGDRIAVGQTLRPLAEQYWGSGQVRNDAVSTNLNANVNNPFYIGNFADLKNTAPLIYQDMSTNSFYTSRTIRKNQLLRAFPQMTGLTNSSSPLGAMKSHSVELTMEKRFSKGFNLNFAYTGLWLRNADYFYNEWDASPSWRESNNGRPHRVVASALYEFPFGKGRQMWQRGPLSWVFGGWQAGVTYEFQPGPLLSFGNLFYYGSSPSDINSGTRTLAQWFNTANFERNSSKGPADYNRRVFPTLVGGLRADMTNQWNANILREFRFTERLRFDLRMDALNLQNRSQFSGPDTNPYNSTFGMVTSQTAGHNRWIQLQGRIRF